MTRTALVASLAALLVAGAVRADDLPVDPIVGPAGHGEELIGREAPSLEGVRWLDGEAHALEDERGRVVVIRWWTNTCPYCANSAPALRALRERYGERLRVLSVFHAKPRGRDVAEGEVAAAAERLGIPGRVGHDVAWEALRRWWLDRGGRRWTSVTFLLDRQGRVRLVHTGGEFHTPEQAGRGRCRLRPDDCRAWYGAIDRAIAHLLEEEGGGGDESEPARSR